MNCPPTQDENGSFDSQNWPSIHVAPFGPEADSITSRMSRLGINQGARSKEPSSNFSTACNPNEFVLVVGGLGYIGSHTTLELLKIGCNVIVIDNLSNTALPILEALHGQINKHCKKHGSRRPDLHFYNVDFRDILKMRQILQRYAWGLVSQNVSMIKGVVHFAAYKSVSESIEDPLKYYNNNVGGLIGFCQLLSSLNIKNLVFSSSATVYGSLADNGGRLREELCTHQTTHWQDSEGQQRTTLAGCTGLTNPYGRSKWMCEAILSDLAAAGPEWRIVALRYFNPVGNDESGRLGDNPLEEPTNLMPVLIKAMSGEVPFEIYGTDWDTPDGTPVRDFIHVSDLARAHLAALSQNIQGFRVYNIGTGTGHSILEVIMAMKSYCGPLFQYFENDRREGDVGICVADPSKAMAELGWKPSHDLNDICRSIFNFINEFGTRED